jgi:lysine 2,3-aminomutase
MSFWRKNYRTSIEGADTEALSHEYVYYDPIYTLPEAGQNWWREHGGIETAHQAAVVKAAASRQASLAQLV